MGTIPSPNIAELAGQIAMAPQNRLAEYARIAALKQQTAQSAAMAPLQQQAAQQQIEMQKRQMADQDALTKTLASYDPAKHSINDIPKLVTQNGGSGEAALKAQAGLVQQRQTLSKLSDEQFAQEQKKADLVAGVHDLVSKAPPEKKQQAYEQGLQALGAAGVDISKEPPQYPGDEQFAQHLPAIRLHSAIVAEANKDRELKLEEEKAANSAWKEAGSGTLYNTKTGQLVHGTPGVDVSAMNDWLSKNPGKGPSDFIAWKSKLAPMAQIQIANAAGGGMTDASVDQAAEYYHMTGKLPPGGRGVAGIAQNRKIMNRAAELYPGSMSADTAEFAANKASLTQLQKQFDAVSAFENTAGKNLDIFLKQAGKVVDSGSPWINRPLRAVASSGLGSADQAAFNAARQTALTEIAKVLNSPTGAGVLSDTARKEVEELIGPNASLKQIVSAANILKQDMANRHDSYQEQINDIKKRTGNKEEASAAPSGHKVGDIIVQGKNRFKATAVDASGKVTAADPI